MSYICGSWLAANQKSGWLFDPIFNIVYNSKVSILVYCLYVNDGGYIIMLRTYLLILITLGPLKELYTSETTLAQEIVLAPLNNEFRFKDLYSTSFMLKDPPEFLKKIHKNQFLASWRGLMVFMHKSKVVYF